MALPVDVRDLMQAGTNLTAERDKPVRLAVPSSSTRPTRCSSRSRTCSRRGPRGRSCDVGVVGQTRAAADEGHGRRGRRARRRRRRTIAAYLRRGARAATSRVVTLLAGADPGATARGRRPAARRLPRTARTPPRSSATISARWLADQLCRTSASRSPPTSTSCAARVANEFVKATAWQNALIGGVAIIPGADMPLMTANQAKMLLQIAAAYGQQLDTERVKELARRRRRRLRVPRDRAPAARLRPRLRLGDQGRHRLHGHDRDGQGRDRVLRATAPTSPRVTRASCGQRRAYAAARARRSRCARADAPAGELAAAPTAPTRRTRSEASHGDVDR